MRSIKVLQNQIAASLEENRSCFRGLSGDFNFHAAQARYCTQIEEFSTNIRMHLYMLILIILNRQNKMVHMGTMPIYLQFYQIGANKHCPSHMGYGVPIEMLFCCYLTSAIPSMEIKTDKRASTLKYNAYNN